MGHSGRTQTYRYKIRLWRRPLRRLRSAYRRQVSGPRARERAGIWRAVLLQCQHARRAAALSKRDRWSTPLPRPITFFDQDQNGLPIADQYLLTLRTLADVRKLLKRHSEAAPQDFDMAECREAPDGRRRR
jgi:hypothetical protein